MKEIFRESLFWIVGVRFRWFWRVRRGGEGMEMGWIGREASSGDKSVASIEKMRFDPFISCLSWAIKLSACCL
jgi:hypothetical protein